MYLVSAQCSLVAGYPDNRCNYFWYVDVFVFFVYNIYDILHIFAFLGDPADGRTCKREGLMVGRTPCIFGIWHGFHHVS